MLRRIVSGPVQQGMFGILVFPLCSTGAYGETYYVRTDGNNGNLGTANASAGSWRSIDWAADHVSAGDVVRVQAGTYSERVTPSRNGSSVTNMVTFVAEGSVTMCGWDFDNNSYIKVIGFIIDSDAGCSQNNGGVNIGGTNSYLEFWHNTFRDARYGGIRMQLTDRLNNSLVIGNTFSNFGIGNGSGMAVSTAGTHSLFGYNEMYNLHPDGFGINGTYNRWINNYSHDLSEASGGHSDVFQFGSHPLGLSYNLFEANFQAGVGNTGDEHTAIVQNYDSARCGGSCTQPVTENLWRRNVWHNVSSGTLGISMGSAGTMSYNRIYHNSTLGAVRAYPTTPYGMALYSGVSNTYLLNNLEYKSWGDSVSSNVEVYYVDHPVTIDYNLAYDPARTISFRAPWTLQAHPQTNVNPALVDYANDNFTLGSGSGARGRGGPLTTVNGSGSGTTFNVASGGGGFFRGADTNLSQYGGNLAVGDLITVGNDTVRISRVSGDSITVTTPFTWASGEGVFQGDSATPDIGAFPYRASGFGLTAGYTVSGGTVTVTPSDANLVRFVVCFENGVPVAADSASPYTCSVGGGSVTVRVYPLYASKTLFVNAVQGASGQQSGPPPPSGLQIIAP